MVNTEDGVLAESASPSNNRKGQIWNMRQKWTLSLGLAVIVLAWFCDWTDYSLAGTWADLVLPVASIVASAVVLTTSRGIPWHAVRIATKVAAVITLMESSIAVAAVALLAAISSAGMMLAAFSILGEEQISAVVSPDGTRVAEEYYRGGGLLGDGVLVVRVKYRLMPLLERDVYYGISTSSEHIAWQDNDTLYFPGTNERIRLGLVKTELAPSVRLGITAWGLIGVLEKSHREAEERNKLDEEMSSPLKTIPLYPGGTENDNSGANMVGGGGFRAFDIKAPNSDDAAKWYKEALSEGEWSVVATKRRETRGETASSVGEERLVYDCIEALRREADGTSKHYYWRFLWGEQSTHVRAVVDTPERPTWSDCDEP